MSLNEEPNTKNIMGIIADAHDYQPTIYNIGGLQSRYFYLTISSVDLRRF